MNEKNRSNKRICSDTRLKRLVETESEQIFEQALVRMDACSDRRDCSEEEDANDTEAQKKAKVTC